MNASESPIDLSQDDFPSAISVDPSEATPTGTYDASLMSFLAGMFLTICVFVVLGMYFQTQKRKKCSLYQWNNNTSFPVPWSIYQLNNLRNVQGEKQPLRSSKHTTINMYTSKNKADSKYPKTKRKFPYFVTIPEEEENEQENYRFPNNMFSTSFPHF